MKKTTMWIAVALGALGVTFLSGAFESLFKWDRSQNKVASGAFTVGLALAGAYLAHAGGIIDGDTRNMVIAAGIAVGATQAFGGKLYEWGAELSAKVFKRGNGHAAAFTGEGIGAGEGAGQSPIGMTPGTQSGVTGPATGGPPTGTTPVYNINVEAAKIPQPNVGLELGVAGINAAGNILGQLLPGLVGGSAGRGSGSARRQLALMQ